MNPIRSVAVFTLLLVVTAVHFPTAEARDENSFKTTHYLFEPVRLLSGQDLRVCVADGARTATSKQSLYFPEDMLAQINLYDAIQPTTKWFNVAKGYADSGLVCFDGADFELSDDPLPEVILAELIVSAPAESKAVPIATLELRNAASDTISALRLPAVQADAPVTPGRFTKYRPQFYFRTTDVGTLTHIFGPFTLTAGQEVDICAADAALAIETIPLNFTEIVWTVEVHATRRKGAVVLEDIHLVKEIDRSSPNAICTGPITLDDILRDQDIDPATPESIDVVILLYASAPPGSQVVPMATGRLKLLILDEPTALLLPAVQAAREVAR